MKCGKCKCATYCNRECQKTHLNTHKKVCCVDIVTLDENTINELGTDLIELIKSDEDFIDQIIYRLSNNLGKRLTVVTVMYNRKINKFEQLKVSDMSILIYQKMSHTNHICELNTGSFCFIMVSERSQVMISGAIPLSEIVDF
jgi:hypothetical protein